MVNLDDLVPEHHSKPRNRINPKCSCRVEGKVGGRFSNGVRDRLLSLPLDRSAQERRATQEDKDALHTFHDRIWEKFGTPLSQLRTVYARNYAERVFHDRQLCGYISQIIFDIGIDGTTGDEEPSQWCPRLTFPAWVKNALIARERGKCAACSADLLLELNGTVHIDHIIPLASGGCNDLVNLQILCDSCNLKKSIGAWPVTSSVPPYLERALKRRNRPNN
jgi:hypothetical protein